MSLWFLHTLLWDLYNQLYWIVAVFIFELFPQAKTGAEPQTRDKVCSNIIAKAAGDALGRAYVKKYFPPESKDMVRLIKAMRFVYWIIIALDITFMIYFLPGIQNWQVTITISYAFFFLRSSAYRYPSWHPYWPKKKKILASIGWGIFNANVTALIIACG